MSEKRVDEMLRTLREGYNAPPETPRDEMWAVIEAGLQEPGPSVVSLDDIRRRLRPAWHRPASWAAAAAAVLVMGVGIGRMTAPVPTPVASVAAARTGTNVMRTVAMEHLGDTESLLTLVKAEARGGRLDPVVVTWAQTLLAQTRLLLDTPSGVDADIRELLEDLELALVQIVGMTETDTDDARAGVELDLALRGLENRELLPRIQAVLPAFYGLAGT